MYGKAEGCEGKLRKREGRSRTLNQLWDYKTTLTRNKGASVNKKTRRGTWGAKMREINKAGDRESS